MNRLTGALLKTGSNREKQNMIWNMTGSFFYAFASMVLAFLVMRIIGEDDGGIFSFGFSTLGQQMFILAYFGIRPFHITDGTGEYSFGEYLHHRYLTCGAALLCGAGYLVLFHNRYTGREMAVLFLLICYKVVDGFADVYETEFQRNGRLYLTGKSNTFRVILTVGTFLTALTCSHWYYLLNPALTDNSLLIACGVAVAAQVLGVLLFDVPVLRELPTVAYEWGRGTLKPLFQNTGLLFVSVFLDFYVFSAVKYAIDAHMNNASSGYFNIIFMPTSVINLAAGFVIRPFLTYLTEYWTKKRYQDFTKMLKKLTLIISGLTVLAVGATWAIGRPVLGILETILGESYTGKLTIYQLPFIWIVLGGGFYAVLNLYYYVLVILRKQKLIFGIYVGMAVIAVVISPYLVKTGGIPGAAAGYLFLMILMAALFVAGALVSCRRGMSEMHERE